MRSNCLVFTYLFSSECILCVSVITLYSLYNLTLVIYFSAWHIFYSFLLAGTFFSFLWTLFSTLSKTYCFSICYSSSEQLVNWFQADSEVPTPPESAPSYKDLEEIAKKERLRLEELIKGKGWKVGSYPRFIVGHKGQKVKSFTFSVRLSHKLCFMSLMV